MADEKETPPDNLFDPESQVYNSETKTLGEVIRIGIDAWVRANLNVQLPGKVTAVRNNSFVDVQPMIQEEWVIQGIKSLPIIQNIPIEHPRGENWSIKLPVQVGDLGKINFFDRSLDNYLAMTSENPVNPDDVRQHHLSDASFTPGLYPEDDILEGDPTDMIIANGESQFTIHEDGTYEIANAENELISVIDDFIQAVEDLNNDVQSAAQSLGSLVSLGIANTVGGPTAQAGPVTPDPGFIAAFTQLSTQLTSLANTLTQIQQNLESLKGSE